MDRGELIRPGERCPRFSLRGSDNSLWSLEHLLRGQRALLVFYRRDCATCRILLPFVERMYRRLPRAALRVAGVAQDTHPDTLELADAFSITFPLLLDHPKLELSTSVGVETLPTQIVLDPEGTVLSTHFGFSRHEQTQLFLRLARELGRPEGELFTPADQVPESRAGSPSLTRA